MTFFLPSRRKFLGFTMVELLVVVALLGLLATIATVTIFSDSTHKQLQRQARELQGQVELMAEEAQLNGVTFGLQLSRDDNDIWTYHWRREMEVALREDEQTEADWWLPLSDEAQVLFPPVSFPLGVQVELRFADNDSLPPVDIGDEVVIPQIFFYRHGEITPFQLQLVSAAGDSHFQLQADLLGRVEVVDKMADPLL